MKKIIFLIFVFFIGSICKAEEASVDSLVFNMCENDIEVTYKVRFCILGPSEIPCVEETHNEVIKSKKSKTEKNYILIKPFKLPTLVGESASFNIVSAIERDKNGNIIASGETVDISGNGWSCGDGLGQISQPGNVRKLTSDIILDDMHGSPYITCQKAMWVGSHVIK